MSKLYECDGMNVCTKKYQNKQKKSGVAGAAQEILQSYTS
jgi:hypothetical protein